MKKCFCEISFLISESKCVKNEEELLAFCSNCSKCHECGEEIIIIRQLRDIVQSLNCVINDLKPKILHYHK